jgi:nucleoside-diphosphate-sugar epimerase
MGERQVLVTGGSGYIAGFCIARLLADGFTVRATLRGLSRAAAVRQALSRVVDAGDRLSFAQADLLDDAGWAEAMAGCAYVLHVASPIPAGIVRDDAELVRPARDGALRVLRAAEAGGVARVVLTASTAAVAYGRGSRTTPATEADWSDDANMADTSAYERSKTIAERAAWAWMAEQPRRVELVTVCPGAVLGPVMGRDFSASIEIVRKLMDGSLPGTPRFGWPLVDVRDIADLHVRAMLAPQAAGQRYIGAGDFMWMADIAAVLRERAPDIAARVPTRRFPDWIVRAASLFDPVVRRTLFELGKYRPVSAAKARAQLGWVERPLADSIVDTARSLAAEGLVKA